MRTLSPEEKGNLIKKLGSKSGEKYNAKATGTKLARRGQRGPYNYRPGYCITFAARSGTRKSARQLLFRNGMDCLLSAHGRNNAAADCRGSRGRSLGSSPALDKPSQQPASIRL